MSEERHIITRRSLARFLALTVNSLSSRLDLSRTLGQTTAYDGKRDYNEALGYLQDPGVEDYLDWYQRSPYAKVSVNLPADFTWKEPPAITEDGDENTSFVQSWDELVKAFRVWSVLTRLDRLAGIGRYGVLLFGLNDRKSLTEPVEKGSLDGLKDLLYMRPLSEASAEISKWDQDARSRRFGKPVLYRVTIRNDEQHTANLTVHYTRVLHIADGKLDSDVLGTSRLECVINDIMDLMKIGGGSAEATWLNMRPGQFLRSEDGYDIDWDDDDVVQDIEAAVQDFAHDPLRFFRLGGVEVGQVGTSEVVDPTGPYDVSLQGVSAGTRIPQRVLVGSAQGELSAAIEDTRQWFGQVADRQELFAEPDVLRPFINRLVWYGILPAPTSGAYDVGVRDEDGEFKWPSLFELTDLERSQIAVNYSNASRNLTSQLTLVSPNTEEESREWLGLSPEKEEEAAIPIAAEFVRRNVADGKIGLDVYEEYLRGELEDVPG